MLDVMDELRLKCPWDKKQTFESLRANTIEETYELCADHISALIWALIASSKRLEIMGLYIYDL